MKPFLIILLSLFFVLECEAQKKRRKPPVVLLQPKTIDEIKSAEPTEREKDSIFFSVPAPKTFAPINQQPGILKSTFDTIAVPAQANLCPCNRIDLLFATDKMTGGLSAKYWKFKGNIKKILTTEKRDTTMGYWETLSPGEVSEQSFSPEGMLLYTETRKTKRTDSDMELYSKVAYQYDNNNKPLKADVYFLHPSEPVATLKFDYNNDGGLYKMYSEKNTNLNKGGAADPVEVYFKCWQQNGSYYMLQNMFKENIREQQSYYIFDVNGNVIGKEEIENNKYKTKRHTKEKYLYNVQGILLRHSFLDDDGSERNFIAITKDSHGNTTKEIWSNGEYNEYKYKYDATGNWIWKQQTGYSKNIFTSKLEISVRMTWQREIEYYK